MADKPIALIVDDDKEWLSMLEDTIESNYQVLRARTLPEVNKIIDNKELKIRIALVDIQLDQEEANNEAGLSAMLSLHQAGIPCIVITNSEKGDVIRAALLEGRAKEVWFKTEKLVELQVKVAKVAAAGIEETHNGIRPMDFNKEFRRLVLNLLLVPLVILGLLIATTLLLPENFALVTGMAFGLIVMIFVLLALFYNKITGEQFTQLIQSILKKKDDK